MKKIKKLKKISEIDKWLTYALVLIYVCTCIGLTKILLYGELNTKQTIGLIVYFGLFTGIMYKIK